MITTIQPPVERKVTLEMTEDEAKTLMSLCPNLGYNAILKVGGGHIIATKGDAVFSKISVALQSIL